MSSPEAGTEAATDEATAETDAAVATDERRDALVAEIAERLADGVVASHVAPGHDVWVRVVPDAWAELAAVLHRELRFDYFTFLSAIDWMPSPYGRGMDAAVDLALEGAAPAAPGPIEQGITGGDTRLQVLARVYSTTRTLGVTLKVDVPDDTGAVPTWTHTYAGADWHEREAWEMFGIEFTGHPGLRHIYLPSDFEGHPLRKDFPLLARHVKPWPGIVDVEPMPGSDDAGDGDEE
ncbi:MAG TPA: NADH-quinone oxidoreductase subunit C [Acidimicrobiales bacterium]|nr:NADH-quinone oxidoreductase subunit C [Acidimicrobiales bacterium]